MKRAWKLAEPSRRSNSRIFHENAHSLPSTNPTPTLPIPVSSNPSPISDQSPAVQPLSTNFLQSIVSIFDDSSDSDSDRREIYIPTLNLTKRILACNAGSDPGAAVSGLNDELFQLCKGFPDGSAFVELLQQLFPWPDLALEVLEWRRNLDDPSLPMTAEEYSKGITIAGEFKKVKLAHKLFKEAAKRQIKTASTYDALMSVYMFNGMTKRCQALFRSFKREPHCSPTIVTYNTLIDIFGRMLMVDHMEATMEEIKNLNLKPTVKTYNNLISGYLTAWMWDRMENTYLAMKASSIKPDSNTYLLMLRGYGHTGNLAKMEEMKKFLKRKDFAEDLSVLTTLICAYCKSSSPNRIEKIEQLRQLLPKRYYRKWLNVLLIRVYAQEGLVEKMEELIDEAIERHTPIRAFGVMTAIISAFYHSNALDKLTKFIRHAEEYGWRLCLSLYHCKMVLCASQNRLMEMESVLYEMDRVHLERTRRTFIILYKGYMRLGQTRRADIIKGFMWKQGYAFGRAQSLFNDKLEGLE